MAASLAAHHIILQHNASYYSIMQHVAAQTAQSIGRALIRTSSSFIYFGVLVLDNVKARAWNLVLGELTYCLFNQTPGRLGSISACLEILCQKRETFVNWGFETKSCRFDICNVVFSIVDEQGVLSTSNFTHCLTLSRCRGFQNSCRAVESVTTLFVVNQKDFLGYSLF